MVFLVLSLKDQLCLQVDEKGVEIMKTFDPSSQEVQEYRYPRPGSQNAQSVLRLLKVTLAPDCGQVSGHVQISPWLL